MKIHEFIIALHDADTAQKGIKAANRKHDPKNFREEDYSDIFGFEIMAYDADDEKWRPVTGFVFDNENDQIILHTDEL